MRKHYGYWSLDVILANGEQEIILYKGFLEDAEVPKGARIIEVVNLYED